MGGEKLAFHNVLSWGRRSRMSPTHPPPGEHLNVNKMKFQDYQDQTNHDVRCSGVSNGSSLIPLGITGSGTVLSVKHIRTV